MLIYIVEDDKWYAEFLSHHIRMNPENQVEIFENGKSYEKALKNNPDVVCLDFKLPDNTGEGLLKKTKISNPNTEVVIISGQEDIKVAIELMNLGAYDYILKDDETSTRIWSTLLKIKEKSLLVSEVNELRREIKSGLKKKIDLIGDSPGMKKISQLIEKAVKTEITVSITGETGTGKEVVAKSIHYESECAGKFVAVNVAAIPRDLIESELFGHEKGAFTGASSTRIGKFEEAKNGTLFLDEIGEMDANMQSKLLRVLQEREVIKVGSNKPIKVNLRIVTATHKNLADEVHHGNFRQDLYFRLIGMPIDIPPLRTRGNDITLLSEKFIQSFCSDNRIEKKYLSTGAQEKLMSHTYPGNVRELRALLELAVVMSEGNSIEAGDINLYASGQSLDGLISQDLSLKEFTAKIVQHYVDKYDKNVIKASNALNVGKSTVYRMIKNGEVII
ncbi:MAG: two-component system response regulator AtoC [Arenicella sp.]|jgi:two-component system response regulator AtoC